MESLLHYFDVTTLHGLKYISDSRRHWIERLFWSFVFVLSLVCCGILIFQTIDKYSSSPFVVRRSDVPHSISSIPFPAVTFCPALIVRDWDFNYYDILQGLWNDSNYLKTLSIDEWVLFFFIAIFLFFVIFKVWNVFKQSILFLIAIISMIMICQYQQKI